jgi:hypothetical protein
MSDQPFVTTAAALNSFRKELIEGGFTGEEAAHLAAVALNEILHGEGLAVRNEVAA